MPSSRRNDTGQSTPQTPLMPEINQLKHGQPPFQASLRTYTFMRILIMFKSNLRDTVFLLGTETTPVNTGVEFSVCCMGLWVIWLAKLSLWKRGTWVAVILSAHDFFDYFLSKTLSPLLGNLFYLAILGFIVYNHKAQTWYNMKRSKFPFFQDTARQKGSSVLHDYCSFDCKKLKETTYFYVPCILYVKQF